MSRKRVSVISIILCGIVLFGLTGCRDQKSAATAEYLELVDSPSTTLDNVWYNPGGIFRCAVFESLLKVDADMKTISGAVAEGYEVSDDGFSYEFTLRDGVTWHDGEEFDMDDVLFSFRTVLRSSEVNGLIASAFAHIEGAQTFAEGKSEEISGISTEGNRLTIRLTEPIGSFLEAMAQFAILPEHILKDVEPDEIPLHEFWKKPIGLGCYEVSECKEGDYFILEAYEDYYGRSAGIDKIRLRFKVEDSVEEVKNGKLDFYVTNDPGEIAELKGVDFCEEKHLNILFPAYLLFNLSNDEGVNEQLKDVRVREALLLAIDRETIVEAVFPGSSVTDTLVPSWDDWYLKDGKNFAYNQEKAKALLKEAGFDFTKTIRLRYSTKGQSTKDLMNAIAVYWRAIGIQVEVAKFDGSGSEHMFHIRDYDVCYKRLSAFKHASVYEEIDGDGIMQNSLFHQPVYDELIDELEMTLDEETRKDLVNEMQRLDQEYLLRLPLFALANVAYVNTTHLQMPEVYGNLWYRYDLCFDEWRLVY